MMLNNSQSFQDSAKLGILFLVSRYIVDHGFSGELTGLWKVQARHCQKQNLPKKREGDTCYTSNMPKWLHTPSDNATFICLSSILSWWPTLQFCVGSKFEGPFWFWCNMWKLSTRPLTQLIFCGMWLSAISGSRLSRSPTKAMFIHLSSFIQAQVWYLNPIQYLWRKNEILKS